MTERETKIMDAYRSGEPLSSIGERFCITRNGIDKMRKRVGVPARPSPKGKQHANWKGGRKLNSYGYVLIWADPDDPLADAMRMDSYVLEHRLVVARALGRALTRNETVHHINGVRTDNRPENLQLLSSIHPSGVNVRCGECGSSNIIESPLNILDATDKEQR